MTGNKFEVFISHTAQDAEIARLIRKIAESVGLTVWREWSAPPGTNFMDGILSALEQASIAVILVGQRSSENQWLRHEREHVEKLMTKGNRIKPIVIILPGADTDAVNHFHDVAYLDLRSIATSPDVLSGLWAAFRFAAASLGKKAAPDGSSFQELVISLGERLYESGKHEEAMVFLDQALAPFIANSTHKESIRGKLGVVNGMLKFANTYLRSSTQEKNIRATVEETAVLLGNVARKMFAQGDFPHARIIQVKLLSLLQGRVAENNQVFLTSMSNLANTLLAQGELIAARDLQEKVLDIRRRELGTDAPNTLNSMNNLAETLRAQGDLPGARALQEQALEIRRRVLGAEHPDTLTSINNLAATLSSQGDLPSARALEEQALAICRRVLGAEHPDTLTSINNLAATLRAQGDLPGARALQEQVLEISRRVLGAEHPDTSISAFNLFATLLQSEGAGQRALETFRDHLAWLLQRDPASLGADQRYIQGQLCDYFRDHPDPAVQ